MGVVIINGKKYDSVTGLMISDNQVDDFSDLSPYQTKQESMPEWLSFYIESRNDREAAAEQTIATHSTTVEQEVSATPATANHANNSINIEIDDDNQPETDEQSMMAHRTGGVATRRPIASSKTLNRRFVKKPLDVNGTYVESMAMQHIKQVEVARELAKPIQISEDDAIQAAVTATSDFITTPEKRQLSRPQAIRKVSPAANTEQIVAVNQVAKQSQPMKTTQAPEPVVPLYHPDITVSRMSAKASDNRKYDSDLLDDRIEQLSKILENSHQIDKEQLSNKSIRQSRKAAKALAKKKAREEKAAARSERRRFRAPAIMATVGAMAVITGLGVYMILPSASIRMAASKAGIDAKNPYVPAGYSIDGEVAYKPGSITINYNNGNGSRGYSVTQASKPNLTESELKSQIGSSYRDYEQMKTGDSTVYLYHDRATWLKDGMQYTINTNDLLDSEQLNKIINSL